MRLSLDEMGLPALDALHGIDALCLFIPEDERPLQGLAGFADWRLCGALSNILRSEHFVGVLGDPLLFPIFRGLSVRRSFCFGLGPKPSFQPDRMLGPLLQQAMAVLGKAGCRSFALEVPGMTDENTERLLDVFIEQGIAAFAGDEIVLIGEELKPMSRALQKSADRLRGLEVQLDDRAAQSIVGLKKNALRSR